MFNKFSSKKYWIIFALIIFISFVLRFYKLGDVPHGMTWDEAAIGYNGFSVLTTRRDEWLKFLPFSFWSFGDYKAPAAIYINGFFTFLFGMNLFAVRFPFAIAGVMAVVGMMLLIRELFTTHLMKFNKKIISPEVLSLIAGLLIALSPWHLHYSRAGFESGMSLSFLIWGVLSFFWWKKSLFDGKGIKNKILKIISMILPATFLVASMYTYHSSKMVIPLLVFSSIIIYRKYFKDKIWLIIVNAVMGLFYLLPMIYDSVFGKGLERSETLIYSRESDFLLATSMVIKNFAMHFYPDFLIKGTTDTLRHGSGVFGVIFLIPFIFILFYIFKFIYGLLSKKYKIIGNELKLFIFAVAWVVIGILPAALGTEAPHSNRALLSLPGFLILVILGITQFYVLLTNKSKQWKDGKKIVNATVGTIFIVYIFIFLTYINHYYTVFAKESASAFQDGYLEAFEYIIPYEKGLDGKQQVEKIVFTSEYGQPYIYALFARKTNPIWYQGGSLIKYQFRDDVGVGDLSRNNALIVAGAKSEFLLEERADKIIYGSDGEVRFKIYITPNNEENNDGETNEK